MKYCLIQDDDCHWYIIPASKKKEMEGIFAAFYRDQDNAPPFPDWLIEIDGPHKLTFENWSEDS